MSKLGEASLRGSALIGLRQVVVGPLGVARRQPDRLALAVPKSEVAVVRAQAEERLNEAGVKATVATDDDWVASGGGKDGVQVTATVQGTVADLDRARTALTGLVPGSGG